MGDAAAGGRCPHAYVTLSHEILREYREYERTSTTVLNAYIGPRVSTLPRRASSTGSRGDGFAGELLIMQSNGGVMAPRSARTLPVAMMESGPVGGFIAAARIGARLGHPNVIAFDMGGTTAKTSLVRDGEPQMAHGYYIGGYASGHPVMLPVVDIVEVGAGGGSIAWIDDVGGAAASARRAPAPSPGPPATAGAAPSRPSPTRTSCSGGSIRERFLGGEMPLDVPTPRARRFARRSPSRSA